MADVLKTPPPLSRSGNTGLDEWRQDIQEVFFDPNSK